jgi:hypothetical protein
LYRIFSHKVIALCIVLLLSLKVNAQNLPLFESSRWIHFGFSLGTNIPNFKYEFSDAFYSDTSLKKVDIIGYPGITLGAISDLHLGEFFDIRAIPSLVLSERRVSYEFTTFTDNKSIESIFFEFPLMLKYKSVRHYNTRFYVLGGGKFSIDFQSNANAARDPNNPMLALKRYGYSYEFGCGFDFYFPFFKFSPELKLSKGINNIHVPYNDEYNRIFKNIYSNYIFISLNFEG